MTEDIYNMILSRFLNKPENESKTEFDYLVETILEYENFIKAKESISLEEIRKTCIKKYTNQYGEDNLDEEWLNYLVQNEKKDISSIIMNLKSKLRYLNRKLNRLPSKLAMISNSQISNHFPFKSINSYRSFQNYISANIVDPYVDYSYLFQRLKKEKLIDYIKHLDFMHWLYNNNFISERIYDDLTSNGGFRSLSKSYSGQRENNFNNLFLQE